MLPILKKPTQQQFQASQIKLYNPPRQLSSHQEPDRKQSMMSSSRANTKLRIMAGFRKDETYETSKSGLVSKSLQEPNYATLNQQQNYKAQLAKLTSNKDLSAQIKLIQKKIRYHKKKLQQEKKKKQQMQKAKNDPYSNDFQKIIIKEMQLQGYTNEQLENKGFDYLTNPGGKPAQEQQPQPQPQPIIKQEKPFSITQKIQKLEKHYEHSLKKKFQRRQMFPHYPCKRKTPKLYVTTKTNALEKFGKKPAQEEHLFRIMTKQCTPQQIYPTIPNFAIVKDNLAKNVMAYLSDFKPFIEKTKDAQQQEDEVIRVENGGESQEGKKAENNIQVGENKSRA